MWILQIPYVLFLFVYGVGARIWWTFFGKEITWEDRNPHRHNRGPVNNSNKYTRNK